MTPEEALCAAGWHDEDADDAVRSLVEAGFSIRLLSDIHARRTVVRKGAHDTEEEAAEIAFPRSGTDRFEIFDFILGKGQAGATDYEIRTALYEGGRYTVVTNRRKDLVDGGWVENSGQKRPTNTGAKAIVWRATDAGGEAFRHEVDPLKCLPCAMDRHDECDVDTGRSVMPTPCSCADEHTPAPKVKRRKVKRG